MKHISNQLLIQSSAGHLLFQQLKELFTRRGEVPLEHFELLIIDDALVLGVVVW